MKSINTILRKLTFDDLHDWAGDTILNRGKGYVKRIDQLSRSKDNTLAAWVTGSERYATSVRVNDDGDFDDLCGRVQEMERILSGCFTIIEIEHTAKAFTAMNCLIS